MPITMERTLRRSRIFQRFLTMKLPPPTPTPVITLYSCSQKKKKIWPIKNYRLAFKFCPNLASGRFSASHLIILLYTHYGLLCQATLSHAVTPFGNVSPLCPPNLHTPPPYLGKRSSSKPEPEMPPLGSFPHPCPSQIKLNAFFCPTAHCLFPV